MTAQHPPATGSSSAARPSAEHRSWVPVDACRLPTDATPARLAGFEDLFASAVRSVERLGPTRLRLGLAPEPAVASRVAELAALEADCCGFFTFTLTAARDHLDLEVSVPPDRAEVLSGVAEQAEAAR